MKVIIQKTAAQRIDRIYAYGESHFGTATAQKLHNRLMTALHLLEQQPCIGPVEPLLKGRKYSYRSLVVHEHYKLVYRIDENRQTIYIADVWDTRREPTTQAEATAPPATHPS